MIELVFENENFIVCDKPGEVLSVPDRLGAASDRSCLGIELEKIKKIKIFPVHRLDFEVSGLIIYAKNSVAHKKSQMWFENKLIHKTYRGVSLEQNFDHTKKWPEKIRAGFNPQIFKPEPGQKFIWTSQIARGKKRSYQSPHGEWAETHAELVSYEKPTATHHEKSILFWNLSPVTGKSHQLRFEMAQHGFPILGDQLYGSEMALDRVLWPFDGIGLRAISLDLSSVPDRLGLPLKINLNPAQD